MNWSDATTEMVMTLLLLTLVLGMRASLEAQASMDIPANFVAGGVYVTLPTNRGSLHLYTNTGGGSVILSKEAAARLGLMTKPVADPEVQAELGADVKSVDGLHIEPPFPPLPSRIFVVQHTSAIPGWPRHADGFIGAKWFEGGIWTWDYPAQKLRREPTTWRPTSSMHEAVVSFKTNLDGSRPNNFPRINVLVGGQSVPMLLDTGAETLVTESALKMLKDGLPVLRSTSMLQASLFEKLHALHPDWSYLRDAQVTTHSAMLRVNFVIIAGQKTGPVWFTERPNAA